MCNIRYVDSGALSDLASVLDFSYGFKMQTQTPCNFRQTIKAINYIRIAAATNLVSLGWRENLGSQPN